MKSLIIIGGGSSVKEGIEKGLWDCIKGKEIWSLNSVFKTMPYLPTAELWVDIAFYNHEVSRLQKLHKNGVKLIARSHNKLKFLDEQIIQYKTTREIQNYYGKDAVKRNMIYTGRMGLVGQFALSLAVGSGYDEIFLLGYDFGSPDLQNNNTHYYQDKIRELDIYSRGAMRPEVYFSPDGKVKKEIYDWKVYLKESDISIINVSLISNLNFFSKMSYDTFLQEMKNDTNNT